MRHFNLILPLIVVCLAYSPSARSQHISELDSVDWRRWYPLEVGNIWIYHIDNGIQDRVIIRSIPSDTVVDGLTYALVLTKVYLMQGDRPDDPLASFQWLKTDTTALRHSGTGLLEEVYVSGNPSYPVRTRFPLNTSHGDSTVTNRGDHDEQITYVLTQTDVNLRKTIREYTYPATLTNWNPWATYILDIGEYAGGDFVSDTAHVLWYAKTASKSYGTPLALSNVDHGTVYLERPYSIISVFPNPFNPTTQVRFELQTPGEVAFRMIDLAGRVMLEQPKKRFGSGIHTVMLDASGFSSGVYLIELDMDGRRQTRKVTLVK